MDSADFASAAQEDILGQPRGSQPDVGAVEVNPDDDGLFADGFED